MKEIILLLNECQKISGVDGHIEVRQVESFHKINPFFVLRYTFFFKNDFRNVETTIENDDLDFSYIKKDFLKELSAFVKHLRDK